MNYNIFLIITAHNIKGVQGNRLFDYNPKISYWTIIKIITIDYNPISCCCEHHYIFSIIFQPIVPISTLCVIACMQTLKLYCIHTLHFRNAQKMSVAPTYIIIYIFRPSIYL